MIGVRVLGGVLRQGVRVFARYRLEEVLDSRVHLNVVRFLAHHGGSKLALALASNLAE